MGNIENRRFYRRHHERYRLGKTAEKKAENAVEQNLQTVKTVYKNRLFKARPHQIYYENQIYILSGYAK